MPIVQLRVGEDALLYEVNSFKELEERAKLHLTSLLAPGKQMVLFYNVPVEGLGEATAPVKNEEDFQVSLRVWETVIRPTQLQKREALLPVYGVFVVDAQLQPRSSGNEDASLAPLIVPGYGDGPKTNKSRAPMKSGAPPSNDNSNQPMITPYASSDVSSSPDWYHSHEKAVNLLQSFIPLSSDKESLSTIQVTVRYGEASCRIPFNPFNRPDITSLKQSVSNSLIPKLPKDQRDAILGGIAQGSVVLQLCAVTPGVAVDIEIEENGDIAFICEEIKRLNDDYEVQLVAEWVAADEIPPAISDDIRTTKSDLVESIILPPRSALSVNLSRIPKRSPHKPQPIPLDDEAPSAPPPQEEEQQQ